MSTIPPFTLLNDDERLTVSIDQLHMQQALLKEDLKKNGQLDAFTDFAYAGNKADQQIGSELIERGLLGCILLAGGQGTRLQFDGPKGCYPISIIHKKSLFQLCAEKVRLASLQAGRPLLLAVMTSQDNDTLIRTFFEDHNFFGLEPDQLNFFVQQSLPLLDRNGNLFLESQDKIACGPNGNGMCLHDFVKAGIADAWAKKGVSYVHVILIDNPLADPFDPELLGFHVRQNNAVTLKCIEKMKPEEKVGVLVKIQGKCQVVEYTELPPEERNALFEGHLKHCCANLSMFCFSMNFIRELAEKSQLLPLHRAWKSAKYLDVDGTTKRSLEPMAWKFETYIFDALLFTDRIGALLYPREECFAPLKNASGEDSPETVRAALQLRDRKAYRAAIGCEAPPGLFEWDPFVK